MTHQGSGRDEVPGGGYPPRERRDKVWSHGTPSGGIGGITPTLVVSPLPKKRCVPTPINPNPPKREKNKRRKRRKGEGEAGNVSGSVATMSQDRLEGKEEQRKRLRKGGTSDELNALDFNDGQKHVDVNLRRRNQIEIGVGYVLDKSPRRKGGKAINPSD